MSKPVFSISIPEYSSTNKPDYKTIGKRIHSVIKDHFPTKHLVIRCLSLQDHPGMQIDDLIHIISESGTDRYDKNRKMSVAHDFYTEKGVELFATPYDGKAETITEIIEDMYESTLGDRGYSLKVDLMVIYDQDQLELVPIKYDDGGIGTGDYKFRYPERKADAVLGFIKIL